MRKFFLFLFIVFFIPASVKAFSLGSDKFFVTIDPGGTDSLKIFIKNEEKTDKNFNLFALGVTQNDIGKTVFISGGDSAENWVKPERKTVVVKAGEQVSVIFNVKIPENVEPGAHHVGLVVESTEDVAGQTGIRARLASVLTLQISGEARENLVFKNWKIKSKIITKKEIPFEFVLENLGNIDVGATALYKIDSIFKTSDFFGSVDIRGNILSKSSRFISGIFSFSEKYFFPGPHKLSLQITYGRTGQKILAEKTVWYFPNWFLIFISFIIFVGIFFRIKNRSKNG